MKCFNCQQDGHVASQCTWQADLADPAGRQTPWCGQCDPRTRHLVAGDLISRCPECHPLRDQMLAHHKRCPHCHRITVAWDSSQDCEHHILAGVDRPYVPVEREKRRTFSDDDLIEMAKQQVSESRKMRDPSL